MIWHLVPSRFTEAHRFGRRRRALSRAVASWANPFVRFIARSTGPTSSPQAGSGQTPTIEHLEARQLLSSYPNIIVAAPSAAGSNTVELYTFNPNTLNPGNPQPTGFPVPILQQPGTDGPARGIGYEASGAIQIYNGTNTPILTTYTPGSTTPFSNHSATKNVVDGNPIGWSTLPTKYYGGLAVDGQYVFVTDMVTGSATPNDTRGLIRFDTANNYAAAELDTDAENDTRTQMNLGVDFTDVSVGLDGIVYAVAPPNSFDTNWALYEFNTSDPRNPNVFDQIAAPIDLVDPRTNKPLTNVAAITADGNGDLYVGTANSDLLKVNATDTTFIAAYPSPGYNATDLQFDANGDLLATSGRNVAILNENLVAQVSFNLPVSANGTFATWAQATVTPTPTPTPTPIPTPTPTPTTTPTPPVFLPPPASPLATSANSTATTLTITLPGNFFVGESVTLAGFTPSAYNGSYTIASVITGGFTVSSTANPGPASALGTVATAPGAIRYPLTLPQMTFPSSTIGQLPLYNFQVLYTDTNGVNYLESPGLQSANPLLATSATSTATALIITVPGTYLADESVTLAGFTPSDYNGTYTITSVVTGGFTVSSTASPAPASVLGTVTTPPLTVTLPDGSSEPAQLTAVLPEEPGLYGYTSVVATYQIPAPAEAGLYSVALQPDQIENVSGYITPGAALGTFSAAASETPVATGPAPDLAPRIAGKLPGAVVAGAKGSVKLVVANDGTAPVNSPVQIALYVSPDAAYDENATLLGQPYLVKLKIPVKKSRAVTLHFNYPQFLSAGGYYLLAYVNQNFSLLESDYSNSVAVSTATTVISPAFVDLGTSFPPHKAVTYNPGQNAFENVTVSNFGNSAATGSLTIDLSATSASSIATGTLISFIHNINLAPGASQTFKIKVPLTGLSAGTYNFVADVDPNDTFNESTLSNNIAIDPQGFTMQ
jgi:hypothetical protein